MLCHFSRQRRQHVAVPCCATLTGSPLKGVCCPSFSGLAGARRWLTSACAWASKLAIPCLRTYTLSFAESLNFRRNGERASAATMSSGLRRVCMLIIVVTLIEKSPGCVTQDAPGLSLWPTGQQIIAAQLPSENVTITSFAQAERRLPSSLNRLRRSRQCRRSNRLSLSNLLHRYRRSNLRSQSCRSSRLNQRHQRHQ